ncbi:hypothetical protein HYX07_02550 [Candidatus Woesearchaeota archaeon]|nr:hypothetical protein [Candidatus Woesearchaeota archaeon]
MPLFYEARQIKTRTTLGESEIHGKRVVTLPVFKNGIVSIVDMDPKDDSVLIGIKTDGFGRLASLCFSWEEINHSSLCDVLGIHYVPKNGDYFFPDRVKSLHFNTKQ